MQLQSVNRFEYPQLDSLLWDSQAVDIDKQIVFNIYEKRWQFVQKDKLSQKEQELIDELIVKFGKGLFLVNG
ncbi:hypothetical protein ACGTJS_07825 [Faucicola mancuniensis]|uniref:hypothetical protein n=1 Tax=Faucicola mancuniensis TaxID=1309795 RepID=UPI0039774296